MSRAEDYRVAKEAQDVRYENATGLDPAETDRQEYRDYFGVGDCSTTPTETRLNYKDWLVTRAGETAPTGVITEQQAFYLSGAALAELAGAGDWVAQGEIVRRVVKKAQKKGQVAA